MKWPEGMPRVWCLGPFATRDGALSALDGALRGRGYQLDRSDAPAVSVATIDGDAWVLRYPSAPFEPLPTVMHLAKEPELRRLAITSERVLEYHETGDPEDLSEVSSAASMEKALAEALGGHLSQTTTYAIVPAPLTGDEELDAIIRRMRAAKHVFAAGRGPGVYVEVHGSGPRWRGHVPHREWAEVARQAGLDGVDLPFASQPPVSAATALPGVEVVDGLAMFTAFVRLVDPPASFELERLRLSLQAMGSGVPGLRGFSGSDLEPLPEGGFILSASLERAAMNTTCWSTWRFAVGYQEDLMPLDRSDPPSECPEALVDLDPEVFDVSVAAPKAFEVHGVTESQLPHTHPEHLFSGLVLFELNVTFSPTP